MEEKPRGLAQYHGVVRTAPRVVVIGCGRVGLAVSVALAARGCCVEGYDIDHTRLSQLAKGLSGSAETELEQALTETIAVRRLRFVECLAPALEARDFIVAVPTPWTAGGGFDDRPLMAALAIVAAVARRGDGLLVRSTVPIGATRNLARSLSAHGLDLAVAATPDRTVAGRSYSEQFDLPHIIGGIDDVATARASALLERLGKVIDLRTPEQAEAAKLFANVARDVMFGLANEMAGICEALGLDVHRVLRGTAQDYPRFNVPRPGPVGGPCLSKDTMLLASSAREILPAISLAARAVNANATERIVANVEALVLGRRRPDPRIAILGVAFKGYPPVDTAWDGVALAIAGRLKAVLPGVRLTAWDAVIPEETLQSLGFTAHRDPYSAAEGADGVVLSNDHQALRELDFARLGAHFGPHAFLYDVWGLTSGRTGDLGPNISLTVYGRGGQPHETERSDDNEDSGSAVVPHS